VGVEEEVAVAVPGSCWCNRRWVNVVEAVAVAVAEGVKVAVAVSVAVALGVAVAVGVGVAVGVCAARLRLTTAPTCQVPV
jgi:hypothetical protein